MKKAVKYFLFLLVISIFPYYYSVVYDFKEEKPFNGNTFYNPYSHLNQHWLKCNFHSHSKTAFGLANGSNSTLEMEAKYDSLDYDIAALSNYNSVYTNNDSLSVPCYEHGFNIGAKHQLVLNENSSSYFDYPFFQSKHHKQFIINKLKTKNNLLAIAHPRFKSGFTPEDFRYLTNYDFVEAVSVRAISVQHWDAALSSGHAVWGLSSDDSHDISDAHCGVCWNMINVRNRDSREVVGNLRTGCFYATKGWLGQEMYRLKELTVLNDTLRLKLTVKADSIILISDNGLTVATAINTDSIEYLIKPENTYVRAEIFETEPWNEYTRSYLNPVIRTEDGNINNIKHKLDVNWIKTFLYWMVVLGIQLGLIIIMLFFYNSKLQDS